MNLGSHVLLLAESLTIYLKYLESQGVKSQLKVLSLKVHREHTHTNTDIHFTCALTHIYIDIHMYSHIPTQKNT